MSCASRLLGDVKTLVKRAPRATKASIRHTPHAFPAPYSTGLRTNTNDLRPQGPRAHFMPHTLLGHVKTRVICAVRLLGHVKIQAIWASRLLGNVKIRVIGPSILLGASILHTPQRLRASWALSWPPRRLLGAPIRHTPHAFRAPWTYRGDPLALKTAEGSLNSAHPSRTSCLWALS